MCAPAPVPRLVRRRSVDHRVCRAPTKRPAPRRRRPPIAASRAYFVLTVFFFGFLISLFWVFLPFAMISPRFHCRCGSGCFASCPTPTRHRVSLNEAVLCAAWYRPCGAAATRMRLPPPFNHGQAAELRRSSGVLPPALCGADGSRTAAADRTAGIRSWLLLPRPPRPRTQRRQPRP